MNCWLTLGLMPTSDERAIKRAYFTQLKLHRPEDDALAFQRVREAYETALDHSTQPWLWPDEAPEPEPKPNPTVSDVDVEPAAESKVTPPETVFPRPWTDDDLPAWLRDTGEDEPPPADEPANTRPPSEAEPPAAPDPASTLHDKAEHIVADLLDQWRHADPTQDLTALLPLVWCQREWQPPAAELALELALLHGLATAPNLDDAPIESDMAARLAPWIGQAAVHYGWFPRTRYRPELPDMVLGTLLIRLLTGSVGRVWQLAAKGDTASAQTAFAAQMSYPLFMQLDLRRALARRWADKLSDANSWPDGVAQAVFTEFDWEHEPGACPPELLQRYLLNMDRSLLARIATGDVTHDHIDKLAANALLVPRIDFDLWARSDRPEWHARMNRALIWLQGNAPDALRVIEPKVLRFWVSPRPVVSHIWTALGVICAFFACLWMSEHLPASGSTWVWLLIMGVTILSSVSLGSMLARGLAWMRVEWVVRLHWPWSDWDRRLTRKIPVLRRWVENRDIGLTRDWLPVLALYVFELRGFIQHDNQLDTPLWQYAVVALLPTIFVGVFWRGAMLMLADAPGAEHWLARHKAGLRETPPVVLAAATEDASVTAGKVAAQSRRKLWLTRALGVVVLLIGLYIGLQLVLNTPRPGEAVFEALFLLVLGGWVAWRPEDLQ